MLSLSGGARRTTFLPAVCFAIALAVAPACGGEDGGTRAIFDLEPVDESLEPVNLRMYLRSGGKPLTETWMYQWSLPPAGKRGLW